METTQTTSKFHPAKLVLLSRNRYYHPVREKDDKLIEVVCKTTGSIPVCFGSILDASQALQFTKRFVREACNAYDESKPNRRNDTINSSRLSKRLDELEYWLRYNDQSTAYKYGTRGEDFVPRSRKRKYIYADTDSISAITGPAALTDTQAENKTNKKETTEHIRQQQHLSTTTQQQQHQPPPPKNDTVEVSIGAAKKKLFVSSSCGVARHTMTEQNSEKSSSGSLSAFESFKAASAASSSATKRVEKLLAQSVAVQPPKKEEGRTTADPDSSKISNPPQKDKETTPQDHQQQHKTPVPNSDRPSEKKTKNKNKKKSPATKLFDVSALLPVSRTKNYEPAKAPDGGIIELKCKATNIARVCFGNTLDASLALGTTKRLVKRALEQRHDFPTFTLQYAKDSKAYRYGAHDEDFARNPPKETPEERLQRWRGNMAKEQKKKEAMAKILKNSGNGGDGDKEEEENVVVGNEDSTKTIQDNDDSLTEPFNDYHYNTFIRPRIYSAYSFL